MGAVSGSKEIAMKLVRIPLFAVALSILSAGPALADRYVEVPELDKKATSLKIRIVKYTGGTNGEMIVEVKNTGQRIETFQADSMYFVPKGDPEKAPQRLGAAGPFRAKKGKTWIKAEKMAIAPGKTQRLHLQVFCIDSHRSSPRANQGFTVAAKRLPAKLRREINSETGKILRKNRGDMKKSKSEIQSKVWESRDKDWIKLEGERKQEKAPRNHRMRNIQQRRIPRHDRVRENRVRSE